MSNGSVSVELMNAGDVGQHMQVGIAGCLPASKPVNNIIEHAHAEKQALTWNVPMPSWAASLAVGGEMGAPPETMPPRLARQPPLIKTLD